MTHFGRLLASVAVAMLLGPGACGLWGYGRPAQAQGKAAEVGAVTGLELPRYASLKSDKVNLRKGPGTEYPMVWVYRRAGLPVQILREFETWREVRDADGVSGWVSHHLLSGRRTALVQPWALKPGEPPPQSTLRSDDNETASPVAKVEAGVIANIHSCNKVWCQITVEQFKGYIPQKQLWGVEADEEVRP